jgi:hypothetical protein
VNSFLSNIFSPAPAEAFLLETLWTSSQTIVSWEDIVKLWDMMGSPLVAGKKLTTNIRYKEGFHAERMVVCNKTLMTKNCLRRLNFWKQDMTEWFRTINRPEIGSPSDVYILFEVNGSSAAFGDEHDTSPIDADSTRSGEADGVVPF